MKAMEDFMLRLLLVCACIDIGFEVGFAEPDDRSHCKLFLFYTLIAWIEGFAIFAAVFIVAFVGSYNDYKKEEQFL
jgi:Ca2+ transporting ATPase